MHRRYISIAMMLIGIAVLCLICLPATPYFSQCIVSDAEFSQIARSRSETSEDLITGIRFNDYSLSLDAPGNRWFYSLIEDDATAFDPLVEITTVYPGVRFAFENKAISADLIRNSESIRMIVYTNEVYREYCVACTTLPILELSFEDSIGIEDTDADIRLFDNRSGAANRVTTSDAWVHIRGNLSTWYPKKGYKLNLYTNSLGNNQRNNDVSLLGMRQDNDWILTALYNDQDRVRQILSSDLWATGCGTNNRWGLENCNEYRYVEVFCNNEYWGLYLLGYPIDRLQLGISGTTGQTEYYYKKVSYDVPTAQDLSTGVQMSGFTFGGSTLSGPTETPTTEDWAALGEYYSILRSPNFRIWDLYDVVDRDNLIDTYLFILMIQGVDNCGKNYYISAKDSAYGRTYLFTPWDFDLSWGNTYDDNGQNYTVCTVGPDANLGFEPAMILINKDFNGMAPAISARYQQLRSGPWSDSAIDALLAHYEADIFHSGAYARDALRWPDSNQSGQSDLSAFRAIVEARLEHLDAYILATYQ